MKGQCGEGTLRSKGRDLVDPQQQHALCRTVPYCAVSSTNSNYMPLCNSRKMLDVCCLVACACARRGCEEICSRVGQLCPLFAGSRARKGSVRVPELDPDGSWGAGRRY